MGEITSLIEDVQKDKDQFAKLEQAMEPLINKYMRKLYKDDKDDVYAELILALWEAVTKLKYVENDGQCLRFLEKALQNKFYELYRSSRKKHDNQFASEMEMIDITVYEENKFIDIIIEEDLKQILKKYKGMKYKIYKDILGGELSDYKIAKKYNITRQYVHRLRKQLYLELSVKFPTNREKTLKYAL